MCNVLHISCYLLPWRVLKMSVEQVDSSMNLTVHKLLCDDKRLAYICYELNDVGFKSGQWQFSSSPKRPDPLWGLLSLIFTGYMGSYQWVKLSGCQVGHSPASGAEVRNVWSCTSTPFFLMPSWRGQGQCYFFFLQVRSCIVYFLLAADRQGGKLERCKQVQGFCCDSALRCVLFFPR